MKRLNLILIILIACFGNPLPVKAQHWVTVLSDVLIKKFVVSPAYAADGVIFSIEENQGLYTSVNRGIDWALVYTPADTNDPSEWIRDVVIAPDFTESNMLLMVKGSGEIKQSSNGGNDWNILSSPENESVKALAFSANYLVDQTIFCWTYNGAARFWRTTVPDMNWELVYEFSIPLEFDDLKSAGDGTGSQTLYSSMILGGHFLRSLDEGITWSNVAGWSAMDILNNVSCSSGFSNDSAVFITGYKEGLAEGNVMKSVNGGGAWSISYSTGDYIHGLSLSPSYPSSGKLMIGTNQSGILVSENGGDTWTAMNNGLTSQHVLAVVITADDPFEAFASTYNVGALPDKIWKYTTVSDIEKNTYTGHFKIFPNPAHGQFEIAISITEFEVRVINSYGQVLLQQRNSGIINIERMPGGTYIVEVKTSGSISREKVIIY